MPVKTAIQVTDSVRHTVEEQYADLMGWGWTPVFTRVTE